MGWLDIVLLILSVLAAGAAYGLWRQRGDEAVALPEPDSALIAAIGGDING